MLPQAHQWAVASDDISTPSSFTPVSPLWNIVIASSPVLSPDLALQHQLPIVGSRLRIPNFKGPLAASSCRSFLNICCIASQPLVYPTTPTGTPLVSSKRVSSVLFDLFFLVELTHAGLALLWSWLPATASHHHPTLYAAYPKLPEPDSALPLRSGILLVDQRDSTLTSPATSHTFFFVA
ncbi:hypothetical protein C8034_v004360 [Colletotrichum sidae]|uniref:Uncharacterized protein n=1 Tax=Colletotrichum sidae TaxID=1347389 RepID=A0A4R8T8D7_9PEZI|nr:hypothetical protein C8034_v004360 [Colletotrichum sidae]